MVQPRWKTFEEQVRGIASLIYGAPCEPSRIAGTNFDAVIDRDLETIVIEITRQFDVDKVRQGVTRLTLARQALATEGILLRGFIILERPPTPAMIEAANSARFFVGSSGQFASQFFQFPIYKNARIAASFGSSIDPNTGEIDKLDYVPVRYIRLGPGKTDLGISDIADHLYAGKNVVLLGEYGSGKSRCVRQLFNELSHKWNVTFKFPFAINLRECWGLDSADEIIRRGVKTLGLDELASSAVRAFNRKCLTLLLDGFDELGSQSWGTDEGRIRQIRARALAGVRDLINKGKSGCLIAGREHYFSSNEEMLSALGLRQQDVIVIKAKDEFTDGELEQYFDLAGINAELPSWLPKRPLICQTIALLSDDELGQMFDVESEGVSFWNHFINVLCLRDARINSVFDYNTIYKVYIALSRITRTRPANIGPISQRDLQDAFESVVGQLPVEEASVMLQRLPSLGRIGAESQDRQFVDMFILDGLRAKDVAGLPEEDDVKRRQVMNAKWLNPLQILGQLILSDDIGRRIETFREIAKRAASAKNATLAADIVTALARSNVEDIDLNGLVISEANVSEISLNGAHLKNLTIEASVFDHIVLPGLPPDNVKILESVSSKVSGVASYNGLPEWANLTLVEEFDSVATVAQIRKVGLRASQEILVAVLKKTFKQKGGGRKEEALLRGFGAGTSKKIAASVVKILMQKKILTRHKGDEGWVYNPNLGEGGRIDALLASLRSSSDPLWTEVSALDS